MYYYKLAQKAISLVRGLYLRAPKPLKFVILVMPILIFAFPMLLSGRGILAGDYDMQVQMTEAARRSIMIYHQFPIWNPWVSGGVPLFADPQFGLFTPSTFLALFIGSGLAWKVTLFIYFIVAFLSMRKLLNYLTVNNGVVSSLIAYIWTFGSFFVLRSTGHFTFMLLSFLPLAVYLSLRVVSTDSKRYLVYLTLLMAYSLNAAMHYSSILMLISVFILLAVNVAIDISSILIFNPNSLLIKFKLGLISILNLIYKCLFVCVGILLFNLPRVLLSYQYLSTNSVDRTGFYERFIGLEAGLGSIVFPFNSRQFPSLSFGGFEASAYIGEVMILLSLVAAIYLVTLIVKNRSIRMLSPQLAGLVVLGVVAFTLGLGGVPYSIVQKLPAMSSMRVSTRWLLITSFSILAVSAIVINKLWYEKIRGLSLSLILSGVLLVATAQVFFVNFKLQKDQWVSSSIINPYNGVSENIKFKEERNWRTIYDDLGRYKYHALTEATLNNKGQIIADNALVDTEVVPTVRCDEDDPGCNFVLTDNATITYWSPNEIILERTGPGDIRLNMNPGKHWLVNGRGIFKNYKVVDSSKEFTISEFMDSHIVITYSII